MEIKLRIDDEGGPADREEGTEELTSLYQWLSRDPELRHEQTVVGYTPAAGEPGSMGATLDIINVLISNSISLGGLILSYRAWRDSRSEPPRVRLEADQITLSLDDASQQALDELREALSNGQGAGTAPETSVS